MLGAGDAYRCSAWRKGVADLTSISVAMATYNGARFIREQLNSIAAQTVLPAELVVTDDKSSDDTLAIVRDFGRTAPFPVHVHPNPERLGFRSNFMRAIGLCTSELIALCDQDDVWETDKLERGLEPFGESEVVLAHHEAWLIDVDGRRMGLARIHNGPARSPPTALFPLSNPYGFSMLFRRRLIDFSDLWPMSVDNLNARERMAHDQWLFFLASAFGTVAFVETPLAGYRQHESNTYGLARAPRTLREKLDALVNVRSKQYASFAVAAQARASVLEQALSRLDPEWRTRAGLAVAGYTKLARHCSLRTAVYESAGVAGRWRAWRAMRRDGAYGNGTRWTFGRKAAVKDLCYLILPRSLLRALPPAQARRRRWRGFR